MKSWVSSLSVNSPDMTKSSPFPSFTCSAFAFAVPGIIRSVCSVETEERGLILIYKYPNSCVFFLLTRFSYNFHPGHLECGGLGTERVHLRRAAEIQPANIQTVCFRYGCTGRYPMRIRFIPTGGNIQIHVCVFFFPCLSLHVMIPMSVVRREKKNIGIGTLAPCRANPCRKFTLADIRFISTCERGLITI